MATAQITPDNDAILAEIFIAAPPERVFEAVAHPKQRAQWWGVKAPTAPGVTPFRVTETESDLREARGRTTVLRVTDIGFTSRANISR
jgi:uncharacterized protein YndB with AHSA1/START domain